MKAMKKGIIVVMILSLFLLIGCSNQQPSNPPAPQTPQESKTPNPSTSAEVSGADLYKTNCSGCHGENGKGANAPAVNTEEWNDSSKVQSIVRKGKDDMPGYANTLSDAQIKAIGDYVAGLKK